MRFIIIILFSFYSNLANAQANITVINRSTLLIDSIVVFGNYPILIKEIEPGAKKKFSIHLNEANFHSYTPFSLTFYTRSLICSKQWEKYGSADTFYFFNHGVNTKDIPPTRPTNFLLSVFNATSKSFDTLPSQNLIREVVELSPRRKLIFLNHEKIDSVKMFSFRLGEEILTADLGFHAFNNWNDSTNGIHLKNDSIHPGYELDMPPLEYIIDLKIEDMPMESVHVESKNKFKVYDFTEVNLKRIVFVYEDLKLNPRFKIKVRKKVHKINLSENELINSSKYFRILRDRIEMLH